MKTFLTVLSVLVSANFAPCLAIPFSPPSEAAVVEIPVLEERLDIPHSDTAENAQQLLWLDSIDTGMARASIEYRPIMIDFMNPECPWCVRMAEKVLKSPKLAPLLNEMILIRIDIVKNPDIQRMFNVTAVPTISFCTADGREKLRLNGYADVATMLEALEQVLNKRIIQEKSADLHEVLKSLGNQKISDEMLAKAMLVMGKYPEQRKKISAMIAEISPTPKKPLVKLLSNSLLAVRLGALEVLEEFTGDDFGLDPWSPVDSEENFHPMLKWREWAAGTDGAEDFRQKYISISSERAESLMREAICGARDREARALRILRTAGKDVSPTIRSFIQNNPSLEKGSVDKLKKLEYSLLIPSSLGKDPLMLAHRLIFGKIDSRMQALSELHNAGIQVTPIFLDILGDREPLIRESAAEAFISSARESSLKEIRNFLGSEPDNDVVFAILRAVSNIKSKLAADILVDFLDNPDENLVIAALDGIKSYKEKLGREQILPALTDERWRVRSAALETVASLSIKAVIKDVENMLSDQDEFVKFKAISTIATLGESGSLPLLHKAFMEDDSLKKAVIAAYGKLDKTIPESFIEELKGKDEDVLVSVIQGMDDCGKEALPLAVFLSGNESKDVNLPALRFIAAKGITTTNSETNALVFQKLLSGGDDEILAILHSFSLPREPDSHRVSFSSSEIDALLMEIESAEDNNPDDPASDLKDIFSAFEDNDEDSSEKKPAAEAKQQNSAKDLIDLFEAFGEDDPVEAVQKPQQTADAELPGQKGLEFSKGSNSLGDITGALKDLFNETENEEIKLFSAAVATAMGSDFALPYLGQAFSSKNIETRLGILNLFSNTKAVESVEIAISALRDPEKNVRSAAAEIILASEKNASISKLLDTLAEPDSVLKPHDIHRYSLSRLHGNSQLVKITRSWAMKVLDSESATPPVASLAIFLLDKTWRKGDDAVVRKFTESDNKWLRRAAYRALGNELNTPALSGMFGKIVSDPEPMVRIVLPNIVEKNIAGRSRSSRWVHFFDDNNSFTDHDYSFSGGGRTRIRRSDQLEKLLRKLLDDLDRSVRMEASFALLGLQKKIDLNDFVSLLNSFPDQNAIKHKTTEFLKSNYKVLGKGFAILLPFLNQDDYHDERIKTIFKHFDVELASEDSSRILLPSQSRLDRFEAIFVENEGLDEPQTLHEENMKLVYFTKPGCQDCTRVERDLIQLKDIFPMVSIDIHNINKIRAMKLNEAYSEEFAVPEKFRLVAPSIFAGRGYLAKNEITLEKLIALVADSAAVPLDQWYVLDEQELIISEKRIEARYRKTNIWMIIFAGLLDGINPCAFATIIFFLSYLQIARTSKTEIVFVGVSFIVAVFLSYLAFGLGLNEVLSRLYFLETFRLWFNRTLILIVFIIMVLSAYDGILCLRGKISSMSLQLPAFLKEKIRGTIRKGARKKHFIVAAFIVGCIVSFLELACTGQVYAPMIAYMWQTGSDYAGSLFYLLVYNVMFVMPLVVIFIAAYFGLTSNALGEVFKRHAAAVKFATALLFLVLLLSIVYTTDIFKGTF